MREILKSNLEDNSVFTSKPVVQRPAAEEPVSQEIVEENEPSAHNLPDIIKEPDLKKSTPKAPKVMKIFTDSDTGETSFEWKEKKAESSALHEPMEGDKELVDPPQTVVLQTPAVVPSTQGVITAKPKPPVVRVLNLGTKLKATPYSKHETDSDSSVGSCSYQSSGNKIKELEQEIISLQLQRQSLTKKCAMLTKCLTSCLAQLRNLHGNIDDCLVLHGAKETENDAVATGTWLVEPSPKKNSSSTPNGGPFSTDLFDSDHGAHSLEGNSKKSPGSTVPRATPQEWTPVKDLSRTVKFTPQKETSSINRKVTPTKEDSKLYNTPTKSPKKKGTSKKKFDSCLKPGELTSGHLANDLLKVLKKEREITMNEERTKVCIGNNTWVKKGVWRDKFCKHTSNIRGMVNELAEEIWGYEVCAQMSLTGGKSPKAPGADQKPPAPAGKVEAIYGLCRAHLMWQGMTNSQHLDASIAQSRVYLRSKFNESAKKAKRAQGQANNVN